MGRSVATEIDERPIPFTGAMVAALLRGEKTVTRRVVKPQWPRDVEPKEHSAVPGYWLPYGADGRLRNDLPGSRKNDCGLRCRYGSRGTRLWVQEAHWMDRRDPTLIIFDQPDAEGRYVWRDHHGKTGFYDRTPADLQRHAFWKKRPPMFTRRWMARLERTVTAVTMEPVQAITEADVFAEGVRLPATAEGKLLLQIGGDRFNPAEYEPECGYIRAHFAALWDSINYDRGYGWRENPWTFRVEMAGE